MSDFKWRHFKGEMILGCVRWYCKYGISYRDLEDMMLERGMEKRLRWYWKPTMGYSWKVDETYVKVKGKWRYLYRAIDKRGHTIVFYLSPTRNTKVAKLFLGKALKGMKSWAQPQMINTDKAPTFGPAIAQLKEEGKCPKDTVHRQVKYLNNRVEADHGKLKRLINPVRGLKSLKTAYATIKGFEVIRLFRKGKMNTWINGQGLPGEIRLIERQFETYTA